MPSIVVLLTATDRLPDEIAMHFALGGAADGFFDRWAVVAILVAFAVGSTAVFALLTHRHARLSPAPIASGDPGRQLAGTAWAVAGVFGTVTYFAIAANLDLADAADAVLPGCRIRFTCPLSPRLDTAPPQPGGRPSEGEPPDPAALRRPDHLGSGSAADRQDLPVEIADLQRGQLTTAGAGVRGQPRQEQNLFPTVDLHQTGR
ncbi:DUF1648 domain-containing protein [Pseudonocardia sp.]|uniref:DUF1648 domain-containing protein n=1 Tax=Pseudonocardia sp. TaxID=60912 RepID=UPI00260A0649|nr:DUF1648 domain-containing protein [Pseudonocardia sp.]